ncbi:MAG: metal-binding protein [Defluviitaleaceae bacterium]|nr:metal-binding protein [Defluviitaleaceae bacterium]MCL2238961.1 metal-binding protein [Defluviitaleaceae bacterium]
MKNNERFFNNNECKHFPCHNAPESARFNCLFCYCPLYPSDACGGKFIRSARGLKICIDCHLPHVPEYYDVIIKKIIEANAAG